MAVVTTVSIGLVIIFWKEISGTVFDPAFVQTQGFPIRIIQSLLSTLLIVAIVIGLQIVGVVLMSAMVIAPAAAARQWTDRLGGMVIFSAVFGAVAGIWGSLLSNTATQLPTGPVIVIVLSGIVLVSLFFGRSRGLVWKMAERIRRSRVFALFRVLDDIYQLALRHPDFSHPHEISTLRALRNNYAGLEFSLRMLKSRGLVNEDENRRWYLTPDGLAAAKKREADK